MAKKSGGSWWPWLVGGAVLTVGGIAVAKVLTKEAPRVPTFWERHGWDRLYDKMPPAAFEEMRGNILRYYAEKGLKLDPKLIVLDRNSMQIDASSLSVEDKQKLYQKLSKIPWPDVSQYGLNGYGISYGSTPWEVIRGEAPAKK